MWCKIFVPSVTVSTSVRHRHSCGFWGAHTHKHTQTHTQTHTYTHIHTTGTLDSFCEVHHTCILGLFCKKGTCRPCGECRYQVYMCVYICVVCVCVCVCVLIKMHTCIHLHLYPSLSLCTHTHTYIHKHTNTHTHTHTG